MKMSNLELYLVALLEAAKPLLPPEWQVKIDLALKAREIYGDESDAMAQLVERAKAEAAGQEWTEAELESYVDNILENLEEGAAIKARILAKRQEEDGGDVPA